MLSSTKATSKARSSTIPEQLELLGVVDEELTIKQAPDNQIGRPWKLQSPNQPRSTNNSSTKQRSRLKTKLNNNPLSPIKSNTTIGTKINIKRRVRVKNKSLTTATTRSNFRT